MTNILIVYAHPYQKSFNHAILTTLIETYQTHHQVKVIDLHADGFNPAYTAEELALFNTGKTLDPLVEQYQQDLKECQRLILVAPIWWSGLPAMLKGFFDKVLKKNFAYSDEEPLLKGLLTNIEQADIYTTSAGATWLLRFILGHPIKKQLYLGTLRSIGVKRWKWYNFAKINHSTAEQRQQFLDKIRSRT